MLKESTLEMFATRFYNDYADNHGGSAFSGNKSSLLINDTDFEDNTAGFTGGGLFAATNCTVFISNVHFHWK